MTDDDDILQAYEHELDDPDAEPFAPLPRRRGGFWMVASALILGVIVLFVEIFANRPLVNSISRTEHDLNVARAKAERLFSGGGTFSDASAAGLSAADTGRTYVEGDRPSTEPGTISVYATSDTWAVAERTQQGTCFYLKLVVGDDPKYLVEDGACTGREALAADQPQW